MKILILEDEPFLAEMLARDVVRGFSKKEKVEIVGPVGNFKEALNLINANDLDLAILDISLGEDVDAGIRVSQIIKQTKTTPVIFLSALPRHEGYERAKLTGPYAYLTKPYSRQSLLDQMELALNYHISPKSTRKVAEKKKRLTSPNDILFIKNSPSEITPIPLDKLIVIEADNKLLKMYIKGMDNFFFFNSPGLKNFYEAKLSGFENYLHVNKTYVINTSMIRHIKDNHIIMMEPIDPLSDFLDKKFPKSIPIPTEADARRKIFQALKIK